MDNRFSLYAIDPKPAKASSLTNKLHVPLGGNPLKLLSATEADDGGAGAGRFSGGNSKLVGLNVPETIAVVSGRKLGA